MKLSKNFSSEEFGCRDGTPVPAKYIDNLKHLVKNLQVLRNYIGVPLQILSGYRTPTWNKKVGGKPKSQHLVAAAGDLTVKTIAPKQLHMIIESLIKSGEMEEGGLGLYPGFVHYDVRGKKARW